MYEAERRGMAPYDVLYLLERSGVPEHMGDVARENPILNRAARFSDAGRKRRPGLEKLVVLQPANTVDEDRKQGSHADRRDRQRHAGGRT